MIVLSPTMLVHFKIVACFEMFHLMSVEFRKLVSLTRKMEKVNLFVLLICSLRSRWHSPLQHLHCLVQE